MACAVAKRILRRKNVILCDNAHVSLHRFSKIGGGKIILKEYAQVNAGCTLVAHDSIHIGKRTAIAYNCTFLTSANPNYPFNRLGKIYPPKHAPIHIGDDVWVGACSVILPGVSIGDGSVVAAGSVVTQNVPPSVLVAGTPAIVKKKLDL